MSCTTLRAIRRCLFTLSLLVGGLAAATSIAQVLRTFNFQGLGLSPTGDRTFATAISDDGRVIVGLGSRHNVFGQALRWTTGTGWELILPTYHFYHEINDVSADGSVIVGRDGQSGQPFRWTESTSTAQLLGSVPGGSGTSSAYGVSRDGSIVVGGNYAEHGGPAFLWDGQMHALEPADTAWNAVAIDVTVAPNGDVWTMGTTYGGNGAVIWRNHQFVDRLVGAGSGHGNAITFTEDGVVAVATLALNAHPLHAPFRITRFNESTLQFEEQKRLAVPVGETFQVYDASDISTNGQLIVGSHNSYSAPTTAVVWEESGQIWGPIVGIPPGQIGGRKVKDILLEGLSSERQSELSFAKWQLRSANGVTMFRDGGTVKSIIVGDGINPAGLVEGWRAEVTVENPTVYADVDPRSTYLRTADEPHPGLTGQPLDAQAIPLETVLGVPIFAGDLLYLQRVGNFRFTQGSPPNITGPHGDWTLRNLWGVFSSSDELLTDDPMKSAPKFPISRVPGAMAPIEGTTFQLIDTVDDPIRPVGSQPTNILHDFVIGSDADPLDNPPGVYVRVPEGATHLFVGAGDVQWFDNSLTPDIGRFGLNISLVTNDTFTPNDPNFNPGNPDGFPGQWHLDKQDSGAIYDVNVKGAWSRGLTGHGVTIGIVDEGLEHTHPDLIGNYSAVHSYDFVDDDADPRPSPTELESHGTAVAGVAAARGGNGIGITGVAPRASLAGLRVDVNDSEQLADATLYHRSGASTGIKIKNHSYGYNYPYLVADSEVEALVTSSNAGTIHIFAAGNERELHSVNWADQNGNRDENGNFIFDPDIDIAYDGDANKRGPQSSKAAITVAALTSTGTFAEYSNFGANVFVTAPSGSFDYLDDKFEILTTDRTAADGDNSVTGNDDEDPYPDLNYTSIFSGTSAAAPIVAGIMALGVQAQPNLDTRFAKHLLARTSVVIDPCDDPNTCAYPPNAAGYEFNPNYGFGLIDADAFTREAVRYYGVTPASAESTGIQMVDQPIPDFDPDLFPSIVETFTLTSDEPLEEIEVHLDIDHEWRGHLAAFLLSPSGTWSPLLSVNEYDSFDVIDWTFLSNAFWGEIPAGEWGLYIYDFFEGAVGTWNSFSIVANLGTLISVTAGDFNGDGVVDAADYITWRKNGGTQEEYNVWRAHFGETRGSSSTRDSASQAAVPEPATLVVLMFAACGWCLRRAAPRRNCQ